MAVEELGLRLRTDGVLEATNGVNLTGKAVDGLGKSAAGAAPAMERLGKTSKETAAAMRLLPAQITDIFTSLSSGMPAWLVFIQQGGQIKDSFGGVGPAFRAITAAVTPMTLAVAAVAVAVGGAAAAVTAAEQETRGYVIALALTGNIAGITAGQMADMARSIDDTIGTQRAAAEALTAIASAGRVAGSDLQKFATVAVQMERATGQAVGDTAKAFTALGRDPLQATIKLNEGTNYLTASLFEQIRSLEEQGRLTEAAKVAQNGFADAMASRTSEIVANLGLVERGWIGVKDAISEGIDAVVGGFRPETLAEKMASLTERLQQARTSIYRQGENDPLVQRLQAEIASINRTMLGQADRGADARAAGLAADAYVKARKENEKWTEAALTNNERIQRQLDVYRRNNAAIVAGGGTLDDMQVKREEAAILAQIKGEKKLAAGRAGPDYKPQFNTAMDAAIKDSEARREQGERDVDAYLARQDAFLAQQRDANARAGAELIDDARMRGDALIELDRQIALRRLEAQGLTGEGLAQAKAAIDKRAELETERLRSTERRTEEADNLKRAEDLRGSIEQGLIEGFRDGRRVGDIFFRELQAQALKTVLRMPMQAISQGGADLLGMILKGAAGLVGGAGAPAGYTSFDSTTAQFDGFRAAGGMADANRTYLVGENGPEILRMGSRGGQVLPNSEVAKLGGGGRNISLAPVYNVQIDSRSDRADVMNGVQRMLRQSQAELLDMMSRGQV